MGKLRNFFAGFAIIIIFLYLNYNSITNFLVELMKPAKHNCVFAKRVIIIGVDGAGNLFGANAPNIRNFFKKGFYTLKGLTAYPSSSAQCWGTMFYSVEPSKHGLSNIGAYLHQFPKNSAYTSIFKVIRKFYPDSKIASFTNWKVFKTGILENDQQIYFQYNKPDNVITDLFLEYLRKNDPKLAFFALNDVDNEGHSSGFESAEYFNQISIADKRVGQILTLLEEKKMIQDSLIVLISDHGGGGLARRLHGSKMPADRTIFFAASSPTFPENVEINDFYIADVAMIVAAALGISNPPKTWEGKIPAKMGPYMAKMEPNLSYFDFREVRKYMVSFLPIALSLFDI